MLDFSRLRGGPGGWRDSFETLVRQLGRLNPPKAAEEFRHIHGAGGDGGIEAYWLLSSGNEFGYQAKFHEKSADVNWAALDKSIFTALETHPKLIGVQVAVACDLTNVVAGRKGKSGWDHWKTHRQSWENAARKLGREIEFKLWTASDIEQLLAEPKAAGLREYWFDEQVLSNSWFKDRFEETKLRLDERFHPEDHVDVALSSVFSGLRRSRKRRSHVAKLFNDVIENAFGSETRLGDEIEKLTIQLGEITEKLATRKPDLELPTDTPFPTDDWRADIHATRNAIFSITDCIYSSEDDDKEKSRSKEHRDYLRYRLTKLRKSIDELDDALSDAAQQADTRRLVLMGGRAGAGKSHLLASEVAVALDENEPALMLLGSDFPSVEEPGARLAERLGLGRHSLDVVLGMLSAAAEATQSRALLVIDAINEGAGGALWRERLVSFIDSILRHPRIAICFSYRSEFEPYLLTDKARSLGTLVTAVGFETPEEQEAAARVYLDRRGIVRPATPWLSPEFTNPLFLRTTCNSLREQGMTEFPRGLRGTRAVLRFYLDGICQTLQSNYAGSQDLSSPLRVAFVKLANDMAAQKADFVTRSKAVQILNDAFASYGIPENLTWLDVLCRHGVLRADPAPFPEEDDPLANNESIFRFAFQRFQDHLIAEALLADLDKPDGLFQDGSKLGFLVYRNHLNYEWLGVFQALAIQFADKWKVEIADHLPGGWDKWRATYGVNDAFLESVRWRMKDAFTERTLEILNSLDSDYQVMPLLVELALVEGHPWNAELLHKNLLRRPLLKRDALWTLFVNDTDSDILNSANRLVDWAQGSGVRAASDDVVALALTSLAWMLSSTNHRVRDCATKAVVGLLLDRPQLIDGFVSRFAGIDDPYVVERMLAAVAGACLRNPCDELLRPAAAALWRDIFAAGKLPCHVLSRDYARLVMELAETHGVVSDEVDLKVCRPPYQSKAPIFDLEASEVEKRAKAVGANSIYSSCCGWIGDFGRYVIESRVRNITTCSLKDPWPRSVEEICNLFVEEVVNGNAERENWFDLVRKFATFKRSSFSEDELDTNALFSKCEEQFLSLLPQAEADRYLTDAKPFLENGSTRKHGELSRVSADQAKLWVVNRVLEIGWTSELFPYDTSAGDDRLRGARIERIGKKYQWIAFFELLARLSDNFWLAEEWGENQAKAYDTPPSDLEFTRDIEPTIPTALVLDQLAKTSPISPSLPRLEISEIEPRGMKEWVFESGLPEERLKSALCHELGDDDWLTLYRYSSTRLRYPDKKSFSGAPFRQDDFYFLLMIAVKKRQRQNLIDSTSTLSTDFHDWLRHDHTDGPYLYELGQRSTWPDIEWDSTGGFRSPDLDYVSFSHGFHWESHLDGSLPEGFSLRVPNPWLVKALDLKADTNRPGIFRDATGDPIVISSEGEGHSYCLIRRDRLLPLMDERGLVLLWAGVGERTGWPNSDKNEGPRRRWNGLLWPITNGYRKKIWCEDHGA